MDDEEWTDWIEHDGKGCPCVGLYVQIEIDADATKCPSHLRQLSPRLFEGMIGPKDADCAEWAWSWGPRVIRYRIRKPRALRDLIDLVENLPVPETPREQVSA